MHILSEKRIEIHWKSAFSAVLLYIQKNDAVQKLLEIFSSNLKCKEFTYYLTRI